MSPTLDHVLAVMTVCVYIALGLWYLLRTQEHALQTVRHRIEDLEDDMAIERKDKIADLEEQKAERTARIETLKQQLRERTEELLETEKKWLASQQQETST